MCTTQPHISSHTNPLHLEVKSGAAIPTNRGMAGYTISGQGKSYGLLVGPTLLFEGGNRGGE